MTRGEAKAILLRYRPSTADAQEPDILQALELAQTDIELAEWLAQHMARQTMVRDRMQSIAPPARLKEQIISEWPVHKTTYGLRRREWIGAAMGALAMAACLTVFLRPAAPPDDDKLKNFQFRMVSAALRGYSMDLNTTDLEKIQAYFAQNAVVVPAQLPTGLQQTMVLGCATQSWQRTKVAMICYRTGAALPQGQQNDLWLFVVNQDAVKDTLPLTEPAFARVNKLNTATWIHDGKLYLIGSFADEATLRKLVGKPI